MLFGSRDQNAADGDFVLERFVRCQKMTEIRTNGTYSADLARSSSIQSFHVLLHKLVIEVW